MCSATYTGRKAKDTVAAICETSNLFCADTVPQVMPATSEIAANFFHMMASLGGILVS